MPWSACSATGTSVESVPSLAAGSTDPQVCLLADRFYDDGVSESDRAGSSGQQHLAAYDGAGALLRTCIGQPAIGRAVIATAAILILIEGSLNSRCRT